MTEVYADKEIFYIEITGEIHIICIEGYSHTLILVESEKGQVRILA